MEYYQTRQRIVFNYKYKQRKKVPLALKVIHFAYVFMYVVCTDVWFVEYLAGKEGGGR